ncbi:MAG: sulfite exporter TauE/SafE family protein [Aquificaceae bacterium]|nr:sulfite exporter TauE/SafE family protein [Aquificaceae bacterium]MCS7196513.1 sulfite exporter TauE/SafE family protein [Aquificaceae bacterium]MCX7989524.1 sulfite exporter TauE/SafE family protein [Aquificaceae bacterium]
MEGYLLALVASFLAGGINSVAGGGTLITFPTLLWLGLDPVVANITNTVALWTGSLLGLFGFKERIAQVKSLILPFLVSSSLGAVFGALILINTPSQTFRSLVPFLILFAVSMLAGGEVIKKLIARFTPEDKSIPLFLQFVTGVYGSYFGAGIGIMMLASLTLSGVHNIHTANALKNLLGFSINLLGALLFLLSGKVSWLHALFMMPGFALGGYVGARLSQRFKPGKVRLFVVLWGLSISLYMAMAT